MSNHQNPQTSTAALMSGEHSTGYSADIEGMPEFADSGAHLDDFVAADVDEGEGVTHGVIDLDDMGDDPGETPAQIDQGAFWVVFRTAFDMPGFIMPMFRPLGIQEGEQEAGRAASDAIYSLLEIYYPKALHPGGETIAHLMIAGPFLIGKVMIMRAIMAEAKRPKPVEQPQAANQNEAPKDQGKTRKNVRGVMDWMDAEEAA